MSRMTRADFLRTCAAGGLAAITMGQLPLRAANNALPRMQAQRVIQHLSELPTDRAPVVTCVSLSPDLQILATAGDDHIVRLWKLPEGELLHRLREHTDWVRTTSFNPQAEVLATGGDDKQIRLWDVRTGKLLKTLSSHTLGIRSIRFSPDGRSLAGAGFDEHVHTYDTATGNLKHTFEAPCPDMRAVGFSHTGEILAAADAMDVCVCIV